LKIALCNEVLAPRPFAAQCVFAADLAPFTLDEAPHRLPATARTAVRRAASDAGIAISGLHWLLMRPPGLSLTTDDAGVRSRTLDVMLRLVDLCADLGAQVLVLGSPAQRRLPDGTASAAAAVRARGYLVDALAVAARHAQASQVTWCLEPLAEPEANFINTVEQAAAIVREIGNPALRTMVDCCAAARQEAEPVPTLLERWLPTGLVTHVQANDPNLRGPGQGALAFADILRTLRRHGYSGWLAVEPFELVPDGAAAAARAIGYLRGLLEVLDRPKGKVA
jgi:D-psicose/D-tagatose/L-ribulose 3-epimerase